MAAKKGPRPGFTWKRWLKKEKKERRVSDTISRVSDRAGLEIDGTRLGSLKSSEKSNGE